MRQLEIDYVWTSTGTSGGLTPVYLAAGCDLSVLYVECSTIASTQSVQFQTAQNSSGPWFSEGSTSLAISATATQAAALRVSGPYKWMRPYINSASTGTYNFRLVAVS